MDSKYKMEKYSYNWERTRILIGVEIGQVLKIILTWR